MAISLKTANKFALVTICAANLALFIALVHWAHLDLGSWQLRAANLFSGLPAGVGLILIGVLNAQLSADAKARIVFGRWRDPLPGTRAFSEYLTADPRIDVARLESRFGPFPKNAAEQNARWFGLYQSVKNEPAVVQVHREYLFSRDYTCLAAMMLIVFAPLAFFTFTSRPVSLVYTGILIAQLLLVWRAARQHGSRFITTVLAIKAAP
jgi:hypothetical protein